MCRNIIYCYDKILKYNFGLCVGLQDVQRVGHGLRYGDIEIGRGYRRRGFRVLCERHGDGTMPQGADGGVRCPLSTGVVARQTNCRAREPVSGEHQHQAPGTGSAPVHRQARDTACARFLREPVCVLQRRQRVSANRQRRQRQTQTQREVSSTSIRIYYH